ncbi:MAG TPA: methyltransferase domain-containing protein [Solirubrobacteraceae bacterium]
MSDRVIKASPYTERFYTEQRSCSRASAEAILPAVIRAVQPSSVVDVGCGIGTWLSTVLAAGVTDVLGLDGGWVRSGSLDIPVEQFQAIDLRQPIGIDRRFDLALCMETGEHLPMERSAGLVSDLVRLAPVVLFSAATPGQGGTDHINEQWPDFWAELFAVHGYECIDAIRWQHWTDQRVEFWYAQNSFLYVDKKRAQLDLSAPVGTPLGIVHPGNLARHMDPRYVSSRLAAEALVWRVRRASKKVVEAQARRIAQAVQMCARTSVRDRQHD